ncbi:MAG: hypothetical protein R3293_26420, partial [Candidatus Promineifilaceae bacterium]|nr:hypothetical protein [Candidatus Promineifilaceae bacterium]
MTKFTTIILVIIFLFVLAGCQDQEPAGEPTETLAAEAPAEPTDEPAPEPTEEPMEEPTEEPESTEVPEEPTEVPAEEAASEGLALFAVETFSCPDTINLSNLSENDVDGETYECGVVKVPENYDNPDGRQMELVFVRFFSTGENPDPVPVLYLSGGPGGAATHEINNPYMVPNRDVIRETRDFIYFDQRGTGLSAPLNCSPVHAAIGAAMELLPELSETRESLESDPGKARFVNPLLCAYVFQGTGVD